MIGDSRYRTTEVVPKGASHPDRRFTGRAFSGALASGYSYAQQGPRFLASWSQRHDRARLLTVREATTSTTQVQLISTRVRLAEYITHVRADVAFGIDLDATYETDLNISVGGSATVTETYTLESGSEEIKRGEMLTAGGVFLRSVETPVSVTAGGQVQNVRVWITRGDLSSTLYVLHSCVVTGEVRG